MGGGIFFGDYVGGRYSVWGPIGLALMLAIGPADFDEFLAGGAQMDDHFVQAPLKDNLPVMLSLMGIWHNQGLPKSLTSKGNSPASLAVR